MRLPEGLLHYGVDGHFVTVTPGSGHDIVSTPLRKWQIATAFAKRPAAAKNRLPLENAHERRDPFFEVLPVLPGQVD